MNEYTVAAVVTTYNGATRGYLIQAIDSIVGQTRRPAEVVVVDDASTDDTCALIVARYGKGVRLVRLRTNLGPSGARNAGVRATRAPWIAFLDDDDEWFPDKLEQQVRLVQRDRVDLLFSPMQLVDNQGRSLGYSRPPCPEALSWPGILFCNPVQSPSSVLVRRDTLVATGGFPEHLRMGEDWVTWARIAKVSRLESMHTALGRYRIHRRQATAETNLIAIREQTLQAVDEIARTLCPASRVRVLKSYAYGGALRAVAGRRYAAARRLATVGDGRVDWPFMARKAIAKGLAGLVPWLAEKIESHELRRMVQLLSGDGRSETPGSVARAD